MAFKTASVADAQSDQHRVFNGSGNVIHDTFNVPPDTHYAHVGCLMVDGFNHETDEAALVNLIEAIPGITSVAANGRVWGRTDDVLLGNPDPPADPKFRWGLHVSVKYKEVISANFSRKKHEYGHSLPPSGKQWIAVFLVLANPLTVISTLENPITAITGVDLCKHMLHGTVAVNAVGSTEVKTAVHCRIDTIQSE